MFEILENDNIHLNKILESRNKMKKSILVIDEVDCCDMCKLGFNNECSGEFECFMEPTKHIENPEGEKPDWCPLRKLPEPRGEEFGQTVINTARTKGLNTCLYNIMGSSDN